MDRPLVLSILITILLNHGEARYYRSASSHLTHGNELEDSDSHSHIDAGTNKPHRDICPDQFTCVAYVSCPAHVKKDKVTRCKLIGGREGICCISGRNHTEFLHGKSRQHFHHMDATIMSVITRRSQSEMDQLKTREEKLLSSPKLTVLNRGQASYSIFRNSRAFDDGDLSGVVDVANKALEIAFATQAFKHRQGLTNQQIEYGFFNEDLGSTPLGQSCSPRPECPNFDNKYRRMDGTCNNIARPAWGSSMTPYARLLPPSYEDGIFAPRLSTTHQILPSPRLISTTLFPDEDRPNPSYTMLLMQFGQFMSHDMTQSLDTSFGNGSAISCCYSDGSNALPHEFRHHTCMPIEIPHDDHFYGAFNQRCMNFVRSVLAPREDCTLGFAQQMNKITHFLDCSHIYGSSAQHADSLRTMEGGKLETFNDFGRHLLPLSRDSDACLTMEQGSACFTAGDSRSNQMISLTVLHTLFLREHNRIAAELQHRHQHLTDDILFLEARKIVTAEVQTIIFKEWLPAVIGEVAMEEFQLNLATGGQHAYDYDAKLEPSVTNEFATAALRFGHSMVNGLLKIYGTKKMEEMISIPEVMFQPQRLRKRMFLDEILSTLTTEPIQEVDNYLSDGLTRYMFRAGNPFGVDLASLNIQRGRDHGLRPYNDYRQLTGQPRLKSFNDYPPEIAEKLSKVYATVDDIDLWVGGLLEPKAPGSIVGPTFRDIIADQFNRLKKGDRYFFENHPDMNPGFFTSEQLEQIRHTSIARIICDNSDGILLGRQAPHAFRQPGVPGNEYVDCSGPEIPRVDLSVWRY